MDRMDELAARVRAIVGLDPRLTEKTMFGGLTFLIDGHILIACKKDGGGLLSVGKAFDAEALSRPGTTPMIHGGRRMHGFVWVDADALEDDDQLADWLGFALTAVSQRPPTKPKKPRKT